MGPRYPKNCHFYLFLALIVLQLRFSCCKNLHKKDDDYSDENSDDFDDDDSIEFGTASIIGLVIGILAILIAVPALLCFCCGCCCFRKRQPEIIGVTSSASATLRKQKSSPEVFFEGDNRKLSCVTSSKRDSQISINAAPSAPNFPENMAAFYYNLGYEPPPPYAFGAEETMPAYTVPTYSDQAWTVSQSTTASPRPSELNIDEQIEKFRLGPSLIKGRIS